MPRQSRRTIEQRPLVDAFKVETGARMRYARERAGVSQKQIAATLGMNSSIISKTEKGDQLPSTLLVCEYARAFKVTTDFLLLGTPIEPRRPRVANQRAGGKADGAKRPPGRPAAAARSASPGARSSATRAPPAKPPARRGSR